MTNDQSELDDFYDQQIASIITTLISLTAAVDAIVAYLNGNDSNFSQKFQEVYKESTLASVELLNQK